MICGTCEHQNQANAKFCSECGSALARACPACGAELSATAKFCDQCGASTSAASPAPASAARPASLPSASSAVRKQVTALFADLVGSTAFAEQVDAETVRATMAPYFELLRSSIEDQAGNVVKFMGDGMMALFGVPEVAEDDAVRAVAAGLDLQRRFRTFADRIRDRHGVELGLRVGINTGELVIGDGDADYVGDVLNTASRLETACEPGSVLVGEDTWRLTRSVVAYEVLGEVQVRGKADPIATFRVVDDSTTGDDLAPFVGRGAELDMLRAVFDDAVAHSTARLATVVGAPGVGKTRLAHELRAGTEARSFDLRFERRGSTTFTPIVELLRELTGSSAADDIARLVGGHPEAERLGMVLASFLGHGESRTTEESFWAVRRLLEFLASDGPVIVVVDDIQWAEPLFWDLLDHLVEWTAAPVLLVALARPELRELRPELAQTGRRVSAAIALEGLDPSTTRELAAKILGIDQLPSDLADRLPESTEGNPLFVRELVNMLVDDGVLARDGDQWRLTIDVDAIEVPPTILSLLASRVERLPDDERQVVELASVIGTDFDRGTLSAMTGGDIGGRLGALIDRLRRKDLIEPSGAWAGDHPVFRFHHVLIRDAAYRRLLKGHRAELHELVGRHMETSDLADDELDVIVAHHYEQVWQYRTELGTVDDATAALAAVAAARLRSAAEQALAREDLPSTGGYALRALALVDDTAGSGRDELLLLGCEALLSSGDVTRGAPLVDEMHRRETDARLTAWADAFRAQLWSLTNPDRLTEAAEVAEAAAVRLASIGDDGGVAKARLVRASCLARLGRVGDCEEELDLALGAARSAGDRRRTVAVLGAAPIAALWGPSPVARAGGRCLDVLRLLRITTASPAVEATSIRCQGMLEALRGRFDSARDKLETSRTTARDLGLRQGLFETELFAGFVELWAGDPVAAEPHLRAAHEGLGRLGIGADAGQAGALLARAVLLQGRIDEADRLATDALESAGQNLQTAMASRAALAEIRASQGRAAEAEQLITDALAIAERTDVVLDHALTLQAAARVAHHDPRLAARRSAAAAALLEAKGVTAFDAPGPVARIDAAPTEQPGPVDNASPGRESPLQRGGHETGSSVISNAAFRLCQRLEAAMEAGDRSGLDALLHTDFVNTSHRRNSVALDRTHQHRRDFIDGMLDLEGVTGPFEAACTALAIRGDRLCLTSVRLHFGDDLIQFLFIAEIDDGLIRHAVTYDADQLDEALAELDRHYRLQHGFDDDHWVSVQWAGVYTPDPDTLGWYLHPDFEYFDHRRLSLPDLGSEDLLEYMRPMSDLPDVTLPAIHRLSEQGMVVQRVERTPDGASLHEMIAVVETTDQRVRRMDVYETSALDVALARYDEIVGQRAVAGPSNRASAIAMRAFEATQAGDRDALAALLGELIHVASDDSVFRAALDPGAPMDRASYLDFAMAPFESEPEGVRSVAPIAVRGDDLALIATTRVTSQGDVIERFYLGEIAGDAVIGIAIFAHDHRTQAIAELDRRYRLQNGFGDDHWGTKLWPRLYSADPEVMRAGWHSDFEYVEHRRLSWPDAGSDELVEYIDTQGKLPEVSIPAMYRLTERAMVCQRIERSVTEVASNEMILVLEFRDELTRRMDVYEVADLDAALARHDEIIATTPAAPFSNRAWEIALRLTSALEADDPVTAAPLLSDDFVYQIEGGVFGSFHADKAGYLELARQIAPEMTLSMDLHAIRGDHFCLLRATRTGSDGDASHRYYLCETDDAVGLRAAQFAHDQLDVAIAELDAWYLSSLGFGDDHWLAIHRHALYTADPQVTASFLHPDFEFVDRQPLGLWPDAGPDEFRDYLDAATDAIVVTLPAIHRLSEHGIVILRREQGPGAYEGEDQIHVMEFRDQLIRRLETFEVADIDAALARYDEILASGEPLPHTNRAWGVAARLFDTVKKADRPSLAAMVSDDFVFEVAGDLFGVVFDDREVTPKEAFVTLTLSGDTGLTTAMDLLAARGDYFCLVRTTSTSPGGDITERYQVCETDEHVGVRAMQFAYNQLPEAVEELDRWYRLSLGFDDNHWITRHWQAVYSNEPEDLVPILHPNWQYVDHRPLAYGTIDASDYMRVLSAREHHQAVTVPRIHHLSELGIVFERIETALDEIGETDTVGVTEFAGEYIRRTEVWDIADLDQALARYDEIVRLREIPRSAIPVWEDTKQIMDAVQAGDAERLAQLLSDGFHVEFVDPILAAGFGPDGRADKAQVIEWAMAARTEPGTGGSYELIATRGDQFVLFRSIRTTTEGDVLERLQLGEVADSKGVRTKVYAHDQIDEAIAELDRWYRLSLGFDDDHWVSRLWPACYAIDPAVLAPLFHPDFEYVNRQPIGFPDTDGPGFLEIMGTLDIEVQVTVPHVHRMSEHVMVFERIETALDGTTEKRLVGVGTIQDGLIRRWEAFEVTDLDAALARYDEIVARHARRGPSNSATELGVVIAHARDQADRERLAGFLSDDFVIEFGESALWTAFDPEATFDKDRALDLFATIHASEPGSVSSMEPIATRGDDLCLARSTRTTPAGDLFDRLHVGERTGDRMTRMKQFTHDRLPDAIAELDRWYRRSLGFDDDHWITHQWPGLYTVDPELVARYLHADFEFVDHRPLSLFEPTDGSGLVTLLESLDVEVEVSMPAIHRLSEHGMVFERVETAIDGAHVDYQLVVLELVDRLTRRYDAYELIDLDAALARYDEIVRARSAGSHTNRAWEISVRVAEARKVADRESIAALISDDFVFEVAGDLFAMVLDDETVTSKDVYLALALSAEAGLTTETDLLATRGEYFALVRAVNTSAGGDVTERYHVCETDDHVGVRVTLFGHDQLGEAIAELDRWYRLSLGFDDDHWITQQWQPLYSANPELIAPLMHPQFEYVDHRPLAFPDTDGSGLLEIMRTLEVDVEVDMPHVYRLSEQAMVYERLEQALDRTHETRFIVVIEMEDRFCRRFDAYEPTDLDAALARYDEIVAAVDRRPELTNRAARAAEEAISLVTRHGLEAHLDRFAPDIAFENRRKRSLPAQRTPLAAADEMAWIRDYGVATVEVDTIAVRGDSLCLQRWLFTFTNGDEFEQLQLSAVDGDGRISASISFDTEQLAEAQIELDRLWFDQLGYGEHHTARIMSAVTYTQTPSSVAATSHPDLVYIDHRPIGFESGDGSTMVSMIGSLFHDVVTTIPVVYRMSDRGAVIERVQTAVDEVGENRVIVLVLWANGLTHRVETYDPEQVDAAVARFDELVAEPPTTT